MVLEERYGVSASEDAAENRASFASVRALAAPWPPIGRDERGAVPGPGVRAAEGSADQRVRIPPEQIAPGAHLINDLGLDSIDGIDMAVAPGGADRARAQGAGAGVDPHRAGRGGCHLSLATAGRP